MNKDTIATILMLIATCILVYYGGWWFPIGFLMGAAVMAVIVVKFETQVQYAQDSISSFTKKIKGKNDEK